MKSKYMPAPVTVMRPDANGQLRVTEIVEKPEHKKLDNGWEPEIQKQEYRLIATQETGEEMFAGRVFAENRFKAELEADRWMREHPEHRGIRIETVRNFHSIWGRDEQY